MAFWIVAWCTTPLGPVSIDEMSEAVDSCDFAMMAEMYDLPVETGYAAWRALRFQAPPGELSTGEIFYLPEDPGWYMTFERERGEQARGGIAEEYLDNWAFEGTEPAPRVREVVSRVVELVSFNLKLRDWEAMGLPIAWYAAMWLAERGDGLVEVDQTEWWDPATYQQVPTD
jgi:hypothetical protein